MEQTNNNVEAINVDDNTNATSISKPTFPHLKKFMSNEYEDMRVQLNEYVIATNVAYRHYIAENKPTSPWSKLHTSLYHPTNGLFSCFKLPSNSKLSKQPSQRVSHVEINFVTKATFTTHEKGIRNRNCSSKMLLKQANLAMQ